MLCWWGSDVFNCINYRGAQQPVLQQGGACFSEHIAAFTLFNVLFVVDFYFL
jgi:hypothetical protein